MAYIEKSRNRTNKRNDARSDSKKPRSGGYDNFLSNNRRNNSRNNERPNRRDNFKRNSPRREERVSNRNDNSRRDNRFNRHEGRDKRNDRRDGITKKMLIESDIIHKFDLVEKSKGKTYRVWEPKRSKLAAAITKGLKNNVFNENANVLYLGASHGYTASFVCELCKNGSVFALDFEPRVVRDLVIVAEKRNNLIPILGDAKMPLTYENKILPSFDILFMDIAQKDQAEIFIKNLTFLKKGGYGYFALKSRAIDSTADPESIFKMVKNKLLDVKQIKILEEISLEPFERDHLMFVIKKN